MSGDSSWQNEAREKEKRRKGRERVQVLVALVACVAPVHTAANSFARIRVFRCARHNLLLGWLPKAFHLDKHWLLQE